MKHLLRPTQWKIVNKIWEVLKHNPPLDNTAFFLSDQHKALGHGQPNTIVELSDEYLRLIPHDAWPVDYQWVSNHIDELAVTMNGFSLAQVFVPLSALDNLTENWVDRFIIEELNIPPVEIRDQHDRATRQIVIGERNQRLIERNGGWLLHNHVGPRNQIPEKAINVALQLKEQSGLSLEHSFAVTQAVATYSCSLRGIPGTDQLTQNERLDTNHQ